MRVGTLPDGARGFDANQAITASAAARAVKAGCSFVGRYVRRSQVHDYDLSVIERDVLLDAGLGLVVVQHVAPDGWRPTSELGTEYGATAAVECWALGLPPEMDVYCDLEGVRAGLPHADVINFCNHWHAQVANKGYHPGLYVGFGCGLTGDELYHALDFDRYWSAYNLNADQYPSTRGACLRQSVAKASDLIPGFTNQTMDMDTIHVDMLGGTPSLLLP